MENNLTPYGRVCQDFPNGSSVIITAKDGRKFNAVSDGDGVAWTNGNAWIHPALGCVPDEAIANSLSYEVAATWARYIDVKCQMDASPKGWSSRIAIVEDNGTNACVVALSSGIASLDTHDSLPDDMFMRENLERFGCMFPDVQEPVFCNVASGPNDPLFPVESAK